jgi:hypothetical protein
MLTIRELVFLSYETISPKIIEDGWRPLCTRPGSMIGDTVLAVLVDTKNEQQAEVFHAVRPGDALPAPAGKELAFVGACGDKYLFLELPVEAEADPRGERRIGRPEW